MDTVPKVVDPVAQEPECMDVTTNEDNNPVYPPAPPEKKVSFFFLNSSPLCCVSFNFNPHRFISL